MKQLADLVNFLIRNFSKVIHLHKRSKDVEQVSIRSQRQKIMEKLIVIWKYFLSYFKKDWKARDYPLRIRENANYPNLGVRDENWTRYFVQIINWPVKVGLGDTQDEAIKDLERVLDDFKNKEGYLYRPGVSVPIELASTKNIVSYISTKNRFLVEVIEYGLDTPIFISDESSLFDFDGLVDEDVDLVERVEEVFGIDISDIPDGNLGKIFERIDRAKNL